MDLAHILIFVWKRQKTTFEAILHVYSLPNLVCRHSCVAGKFLRIQQQIYIGYVS
jgi:hypothetical protein